MLYNLILKSKTSFLDRMFTYSSNEEILPGTRVIVPFGKGDTKTIGIVIEKNIEDSFAFEAKEIIEILDNKPIVSDELLKVAFYMVKNNISDYSSAINAILPPGSIDKVEEFYINNKINSDDELLTFLESEKTFKQILNKFNGKYTKSFLNSMVSKNQIESFFDLKSKASIKYEEIVTLNSTIEFNVKGKKQIEIINFLIENGDTEKKELLNKTNSTLATIKTLISKKIIKVEKNKSYRKVLNNVNKYKKHQLNTEQQDVYNTVISSEKNYFLLNGVTGSGKTEVYLQLVEKYIKESKEAIILVPEISLTPQTIDRFQGRFGENIAVLHSKLNISERADQWKLIKNKNVKIVVGARSAIFAPFENLGIIIIDEEHESSYKSEKNPKYSAIEIAKLRAKLNNAKLILGTATPSIKTMYDVKKEKIEILTLKNRATGGNMPDIKVVDMREELKSNNFTMISYLLQENIKNALQNKEQVILFLNKRGHTSFVFCRTCGYVYKCEACDVAMTYHKSKDRLICHYCGRTAKKDKICKNCGSKWIKEYGGGTEMLEEQTKEIFPTAKVYRMDADTTSTKDDYQKVYEMMKNKEIDILIGTQMLAKGLDFPNVSVVGIVSADISLNVPDFRSGEKTFNLITQVSGRAGRGNVEGKVIIQTYNPENYAINSASNNDYDTFYNNEINERLKFNYPPIINILRIGFSCKDRSYAIGFGQNTMLKINKFIRENNINLIEMTGPNPAIIEKINNRYRFDIILKSSNKDELLNIAKMIRNQKIDSKIYLNYNLEEE
ncbi:primosomal protein N' [Helcococcus ovis]|uniref:primosomal protein N' n=1 Tax=Helcococcus ovis TaxID=72026 RepID=UPI0038BDF5BE